MTIVSIVVPANLLVIKKFDLIIDIGSFRDLQRLFKNMFDISCLKMFI